MITANAITNGSGEMLYFKNTSGSMKAESLYANKISIWTVVIKSSERCKLIELLSSPFYDLLARHAVDQKHSLNSYWYAGKKGRVREIKLCDSREKVYRSNAYRIFQRSE